MSKLSTILHVSACMLALVGQAGSAIAGVLPGTARGGDPTGPALRAVPTPSSDRWVHPRPGDDDGYRFELLATLGDPDPGNPGKTIFGDFEPYGLNDRGEVAFVTETATGEGVFVWRRGRLSSIFRAGDPAPGGGVFGGAGAFGRSAINNGGDLGIVFGLAPFRTPLGLGGGAYRYDSSSKTLTAIVIPGVTPVPAASGGVFQGVFFDAVLNNRGDMVFGALIPGADLAPGAPGVDGLGLGVGIFAADKHNNITRLVVPGDRAPGAGGRRFDNVWHPWINDQGDVAFGGHVEGEECVTSDPLQTTFIQCNESVYLLDREKHRIISIAHQGQPAPGGGTYRFAFGPHLNNRGEIAFVGDLSAHPEMGESSGMYLYSKGEARPVARPGDAMPGGGTLIKVGFNADEYHLNQHGELSFSATVTDGAGTAMGVYVAKRGKLGLVARTGTVISGLGEVATIAFPSGSYINSRGQVLFQAQLTNGKTVLLVATPK